MKWIYVPVGIALLGVYTALNYYIGLRGAQAFGHLLGARGLRLWWIIFWMTAYLYMAARLLQSRLPALPARWFIHLGAYWMAVMVYALMVLLLMDLGRLMLGLLVPGFVYSQGVKAGTGLAVVVLILCIMVYGTWNARNPRVMYYQLNLGAVTSTSDSTGYNMVVVSDIHLGTIMGKNRLQGLVDQLNQLNPEMILFVGDIIDENVNHFIDDRMDDILRQLNPPLGMFAVLGNHEYFGGHLEDIVYHLERSGVKVLRDEGQMVDEAFFLAGREDLVSQRIVGTPRKPLADILAGVDQSTTPVVLMDHQPKAWEEARELGVALQLSGHTHRGQLFPFAFITQRLFPEDWGKLEEDGSVLIVSSGYGTWGPPLRTGNKPEIVMIKLNIH